MTDASNRDPTPTADSRRQFDIERYVLDADTIREPDWLSTEEPLEIRVLFTGDDGRLKDRSLSITMRTPGDDRELAVGFLMSEGIVHRPTDVESFQWCGPVVEGQTSTNQLTVHLAESVRLNMADLQRHFYTTSSCGICGTASLEAVRSKISQNAISGGPVVSGQVIYKLPQRLRDAQSVFDSTGGLHAAGLFDTTGQLIELKEDVGRHNALDKLLGSQFLSARVPLSQSIVVLSGRASFELIQKSVAGGVPIVVVVGAPSTLAVELAREFNVTLIGFASGKRFNVYSGFDRVT